MKLLASTLIALSLALGCVSAVTAYLPTLAAARASTPPLTLAAPAGHSPADPNVPLVAPGAAPVRLTPGILDRLAAQQVERIRVKEFSLVRWDGAPWFFASLAGLLIGAVMLRSEAKRRASDLLGSGAFREDRPEDCLRRALQRIEALRLAEAKEAAGSLSCATIAQRLEEIRRRDFDPFVLQQTLLVGQFGLAGAARVMDHFAAAERQRNRAWSAAVDQVPEEAWTCLELCHSQLEETLGELTEATIGHARRSGRPAP